MMQAMMIIQQGEKWVIVMKFVVGEAWGKGRPV